MVKGDTQVIFDYNPAGSNIKPYIIFIYKLLQVALCSN